MTLSRNRRSCHRRVKHWLPRQLVLLCSLVLAAATCAGDDPTGEVARAQDTESEAAEESADEDEAVDGEPFEDVGRLSRDVMERVSQEGEAAEEAEIEEIEEYETAELGRSAIEDVFGAAERQRSKVVERITAHIDSGEWGVGVDNILRGPAGFTIDLSACPDGWSGTEGITDTEIRIGQVGPQSGRFASNGHAILGWLSYLDYVNAQGGVAGRSVVMHSRDDGNEATRTVEFVNELIQDGSVFSIHTLGSPSTLAAYGMLNEECIPQPFVWTRHPAWGDPQAHPWTTGSILSYSTEAALWGTWIEVNLADELPVVVAALVMDYEFGLVYEKSFRGFAESNPEVVSEFVVQRHLPAAPTLAEEVATLAASEPDVFISMTAGNGCLQAIEEVADSGLKDELSAAFTPSICRTPTSWIAPAGDDGHGWLIVGGGVKDITDSARIGSDAFVDFVIERHEADNSDPAISMFGDGFMLAYPYVEALRIGAELPGGLSRTNFILAVRAIDMHHPMLLDGILFAMNGDEDAFPIEGSDVSRYDSSAHSWLVSSVVDINRGTPGCAWDRDDGGCR